MLFTERGSRVWVVNDIPAYSWLNFMGSFGYLSREVRVQLLTTHRKRDRCFCSYQNHVKLCMGDDISYSKINAMDLEGETTSIQAVMSFHR